MTDVEGPQSQAGPEQANCRSTGAVYRCGGKIYCSPQGGVRVRVQVRVRVRVLGRGHVRGHCSSTESEARSKACRCFERPCSESIPSPSPLFMLDLQAPILSFCHLIQAPGLLIETRMQRLLSLFFKARFPSFPS